MRQVSSGLEYHQENDCGFAKYHLVDASVSNQPHRFPAAISCSESHNGSPISFKILGLLRPENCIARVKSEASKWTK